MVTPVNRMGRPRSVARLMRSATITVGDGMTILKQFSMVLPLSKSRISCVPVPTSAARTRNDVDMDVLLLYFQGVFWYEHTTLALPQTTLHAPLDLLHRFTGIRESAP